MMERRRVELRLIEDRTSRLARFSKRRAGLLKKARELAVLCDAEVGLIVFSPLGKHSHFSSRGSMEKTIERYQKFFETEAHLKKHARRYKSQQKRFICQTMRAGLLDVAQRLSEGGNTGNLNANDLESLKEQLDAELRRVRYRMMELTMHPINMLKEKEKALLQEGRELRWALGMDVHEGDGDHRETRGFTKNGIWKKNKEEGAEHCVGDGVVKADTALRLWWPPFHCG